MNTMLKYMCKAWKHSACLNNCTHENVLVIWPSETAKSKCLLSIFRKRTMMAVKFVPILTFCPYFLQKTNFSSDIKEIYPYTAIKGMGSWVIWYDCTRYNAHFGKTSKECRHMAGGVNVFTSTKPQETAPLSPYSGKATITRGHLILQQQVEQTLLEQKKQLYNSASLWHIVVSQQSEKLRLHMF